MFGASSVIHFFLSLIKAAVFSFFVFPSISGTLCDFSSSLFLRSSLYFSLFSHLVIFCCIWIFSLLVGLSGQNLSIFFLRFSSSSFGWFVMLVLACFEFHRIRAFEVVCKEFAYLIFLFVLYFCFLDSLSLMVLFYEDARLLFVLEVVIFLMVMSFLLFGFFLLAFIFLFLFIAVFYLLVFYHFGSFFYCLDAFWGCLIFIF